MLDSRMNPTGAGGMRTVVTDATTIVYKDNTLQTEIYRITHATGVITFAAASGLAALSNIPPEDQEDGVTIWNDAGTLKVSSPA